MVLISIENISRSFGEKALFTNLKLGLEKGDRIALVAPNGAGKSCLLRILAGKDQPNEGEVIYRKGLRIGFLEQDPEFPNELTVADFIKRANGEILAVKNEYEDVLEQSHHGLTNFLKTRLDHLTEKMDELQAWDYERRLIQLLTIFRIPDLSQQIAKLSGGQRKRLAMAVALSSNPDLLLLDEPTNHLDIEMTEWLEDFLLDSPITLLMVTHDRYFLDRVCNRILELNNQELFDWKGNYSYYLEKREQLDGVIEAETEKAKNLLRKELDWIRRMPKARTTKSKSRIDAFYELQEKANKRKLVRNLKLEVSMARMGGHIMELKKVNKSFVNAPIIKDFSYTFSRGERVGIIGKNGVGKTTLLNLITGKENLTSGMIETGETIRFGYFTQEGIRLAEDKRVIEVLKEVAEFIETGNGQSLSAAQFLQYFMFDPSQQYTFVSKLSGGERRRLHLLMVLMKNPNFLILDEPTNDLDLFTMNRLEEFLAEFKGCLIIVSHDRYFIDKLVDHLFIMEGEGQISDYPGTYTEYRLEKEEQAIVEKEKKSRPAKIIDYQVNKSELKVKRKLTFKEKLEYEALDKEIPILENEKAALESQLGTLGSDYAKIEKLTSRIAEIINLLDDKSHRWLELSEYL
jgi:ABC transport system ATP-binding/permease protein